MRFLRTGPLACQLGPSVRRRRVLCHLNQVEALTAAVKDAISEVSGRQRTRHATEAMQDTPLQHSRMCESKIGSHRRSSTHALCRCLRS